MAINKKDIITKIKSEPLNHTDLAFIAKIEQYIDKLLIARFEKNGSNSSLGIELPIAQFKYDPTNDTTLTIQADKREKMQAELERRFEEAGWKINIEYDDGLDGPNRSGPDYWYLS